MSVIYNLFAKAAHSQMDRVTQQVNNTVNKIDYLLGVKNYREVIKEGLEQIKIWKNDSVENNSELLGKGKVLSYLYKEVAIAYLYEGRAQKKAGEDPTNDYKESYVNILKSIRKYKEFIINDEERMSGKFEGLFYKNYEKNSFRALQLGDRLLVLNLLHASGVKMDPDTLYEINVLINEADCYYLRACYDNHPDKYDLKTTLDTLYKFQKEHCNPSKRNDNESPNHGM